MHLQNIDSELLTSNITKTRFAQPKRLFEQNKQGKVLEP